MVNIHAQTAEEALSALKTDAERGLSSEEAASRLAEKGHNELPKDKKPSLILLFLKQFQNALHYVLIAAAALSFVVGEPNDAFAILIALFIDAGFGFYQERRAEHALERLRQMVVQGASVVRDGRVHRVPARDLVPGDVLLLSEGDRVTADARLLESRDLETDESALTGESASVAKDPAPVAPEASIADRRDMVWMGTSVPAGQGKAVVVETGPRTAFGRIAASLAGIARGLSPLEMQIERMSRQLGILAIVLSGAVFLAGSSRGFPMFDMFFFAVALLVSIVPEGLPAVLAVVLAIGVQRMAKRNAIVRHVPSVETLGAADIICTDKTGTLTENKMTVRSVVTSGHELAVSGEGWDMRGHFTQDGARVKPAELPEVADILEAAGMCHKASIEVRDGRTMLVGDPTEGALLVVAAKAGFEQGALRKRFALLDEVPFSSSRKYRAVLVERTGEGGKAERLLFAAGAFEVLAERSSRARSDGKDAEYDRATHGKFEQANERMAGQAMRVIALAARAFPSGKGSVSDADVKDLTFLGFVGMIDPPRQGVGKAIKRCRRAGIRVIMATGDHRATALAIAKEIGLVHANDDGSGVFTDADVAGLDDAAFREALRTAKVFARVAPETKLRVVDALRREGHVVAMTGDGVNDAPALKKADIGIAMGITGTDVTKEVADMVLVDDAFVTIVNAIEEGRIVFRNVKQTTAYLFMTNVGEVVTIIASLVVGLPLPLLPSQILWMNLVTDSLPSVSLATEPASPDVLMSPPRKKDTPLLTPSILILTGLTALTMMFGTLFLFQGALDRGLAYARSIAFTSLAVFQLWNVFSMRSVTRSLFSMGPFTNRYVLGAVVVSFALQLAVLYLPALQTVFGTVPLGAVDWTRIIAVTSLGFIVVEIYKLLCRRGIVPQRWL